MKCPKCEVKEWPGHNEMCGQVGNRTCPVCGIVEDTEEFGAAVNALLDDAAEDDGEVGW